MMFHDVLPDGRALDKSGFTGPGPDRYKIRQPVFEAVARCVGPDTVLTFDDGGRSAVDVVAPVLAEHGLRGEFFVPTALIGTPGFLDRRAVGELAAAGHVVGSHSHTHPERMPALTREQILDEWRTSVAVLSDILGRGVCSASVPGGQYSRRVAEAAGEAGIKYLFTSEPTAGLHRVGGCLVVGRYTVQRWTTPRAAAGIASGRLAPRLRQAVLWNAKKATKAVGGEFYLRARKALIGRG
jgi:peptidoglycan/xylan/chitin deacetylase (PgdA/CDA1 family)